MSYEIDESRTSEYGVDLIGQIDANLTHLRGYGVMALELIQNADDAKATRMSLDITESALIVRNNAEFSSCSDRQDEFCLNGDNISGKMCDWHAFRLIASRAKSERSTTTIGRFGLGFTSVFQITDHPEVECDGSKLIINPDTKKSGWKRTDKSNGTIFTLPWAFDPDAPVRRQLRNVGVVKKEELPEILKKINETSSESLVFLKNLKEISILNNGKLKSTFIRNYLVDENRLVITQQPSGKTQEYFFISRSINSNLDHLEMKFPRDLGEKNRKKDVEIAIPKDFDSNKSGLIYAFLPTERSTLMPMSINGDFYPDSSRKDIILSTRASSDASSEWNRGIIESSADLFADNIQDIYSFLGYKNFWKLVQSIFDLNQQIGSYGSDTSDSFRSFWKKFQVRSFLLPIIPIEGQEETSKSIQKSFLLEGEDLKEKRAAIRLLGINAASHKIRNHFEILKNLGIEDLDFHEIIRALGIATWVKHPKDKIFKNDPLINEVYKPIYTLLDSYIPKESASLINKEDLRIYSGMEILISNNNSLVPPRNLLYSENSELINLAISLDPQVNFLNQEFMKYSRIKNSCQEFKTEAAAQLIYGYLQQYPSLNLDQARKIHKLITLVNGNRELSDYEGDILASLKIWPTAGGVFISATDGMIPGNFTDPLGTAEIIDISKIDQKSQSFLIEVLKVKILSLESYIEDILPNIFSSSFNNIGKLNYKLLLEELSKHHKEFEKEELVKSIQKLQFIPTELGHFTEIQNCAFGSSSDRSKLGGIFDQWVDSDYLPNSKIVIQFLETLGLRLTPDIGKMESILRKITNENQNRQNRQLVIRIVDYLADKTNGYSDSEISTFLSSLSTTGFLPAINDFEYWYSPSDLLSPEVAEMVASQQNVKILDDCGLTISSMDILIQRLGVSTEPEITDVVAHVTHCSKLGQNASTKILRYLNKVAGKKNDELSIQCLKRLREVAFLKTDDGNVSPADMYKDLQKIGAPWAFLLPKNLAFPDLIYALGIKSSPDGEDLIRILQRIRASHISSGDASLSENHLKAYLQCWELLNGLLLQENIEDSLIARFGNSDMFLNFHREFCDKNSLVIPDSEWFRNEFESEFGEYFVLDDHVFPDILKRLEFRYLSQNIQASLFTIEEPVNRHEILRQEIFARSNNITAALASLMGSASSESLLWTSMDVYQAGTISIEWALSFEDQVISVVKQGRVFADFSNKKLYVSHHLGEDEVDFNWESMFRELFDQLFPAESKASLLGAVAIVSGLMSRPPEKGLEYLKNIGVEIHPREASVDYSSANLKEAEIAEINDEQATEPSEIVNIDRNTQDPKSPSERFNSQDSKQLNQTFEVADDKAPEVPELKSSEHMDRTVSSKSSDYSIENFEQKPGNDRQQSNSYEGQKRNSAERPRPVDRTNTENRSQREIREAYIYIESETSEDAMKVQQNKMQSEINSRRIVLEHEKSEGRDPEEMSTNNVGYDVESTEPNGDIRYIEIKSTKSFWGRDGITLSSAQLNLAYIKKDAFWLYVIENIDGNSPIIYKIQNPAKHVRGFRLNDAWKELAISLAIEKSISEKNTTGIGREDVGSRILHVERGECFLIGWEQVGASVRVTLLFDDIDEHIVLPLNVTKMKKMAT